MKKVDDSPVFKEGDLVTLRSPAYSHDPGIGIVIGRLLHGGASYYTIYWSRGDAIGILPRISSWYSDSLQAAR